MRKNVVENEKLAKLSRQYVKEDRRFNPLEDLSFHERTWIQLDDNVEKSKLMLNSEIKENVELLNENMEELRVQMKESSTQQGYLTAAIVAASALQIIIALARMIF
jgi:protein subunit release factor A